MPGETAKAVDFVLGSPFAVFACGGVLFYGVQKFFKEVEEKLNDDTKLQIAVWLLDWKKTSSTAQRWPATILTIFNRIYGKRHLSWKCFSRCTIASFICLAASFPLLDHLRFGEMLAKPGVVFVLVDWFLFLLIPSIVADYCSLLETRSILRLMVGRPGWWFFLVSADLVFTLATPMLLLSIFRKIIGVLAFSDLHHYSPLRAHLTIAFFTVRSYSIDIGNPNTYTILPSAVVTSVWVWLYIGSAIVLRVGRRFAPSLAWFLSKADIEHRPLQCIGLVSACIITLMYWSFAILKLFIAR